MTSSTIYLSILVILLLVTCHAHDGFYYAALIDAGSSGSRMYVYRWKKEVHAAHGVPEVVELKNLKTKPGLSSLADTPERVPSHLQPLLDVARDNIPANRHADTQIYLMATAGVRLVPRLKRTALFDRIHAFFENTTTSPFAYHRANSRVLSGEEEGVFSWVAVNYNLGFFTSSSNTAKSQGILEMGGASVQVAFIPDGQILANKFPVKVGKKDFSLYVHSYLYYGQDYTRKKVQTYLAQARPSETSLDNPCMLKDDARDEVIGGKTINFRGSSNFTACSDILRTFMWKVSADRCHPSPCTVGNTYQPPFGVTPFYAIKAFVYSPSALGVLGSNSRLDLTALANSAKDYCSKNLSAGIVQIGNGNSKYASDYCMMSSYIPILMHDGLGFSLTGNQVVATNNIDGKNTDWPLGAVLYEAGRQCSYADKDNASGASGVMSCLSVLAIYQIVALIL